MAGLLDAAADDTFFTDGMPPDAAPSLYLGAASSEDATPSPPADAAPPPAKDAAAAAEAGFFERLAKGIGQAGMVLSGGDPELAHLTPEQQQSVGNRALLHFGLSMLANSGPSTTPRNFGQILAAGLESAGKVPTAYEELVNQRDTQRANTALKYGALDVQRMSAAARLKQLQIILQQIQGGKAAAEGALSRIGQPGAKTGEGAAPAPLTPFVAPNLPEGVTPEEDQAVRTVIGEAGGESPAGQQAVAATIKNRAKAGGQSVTDVIFTPNAYEPWNNPETRKKLEAIDPASEQYQRILTTAVRPIMSGEAADPTGGATHFVNPALQKSLGRDMPGWATGNRTTIGNHEFYYPGYRAPGGGVPAPGRVQVAAITPRTQTDATPASTAPAASGGQRATTTQAAGAPGQGAAAPPAAELPPALVTPPELPKMDAPGLASVQASRNDLDASHAARLRALAESPNIHTAQQVSEEQKDYETQKLALDNKARDIQTTFDNKRREDAVAYQLKIAEEDRKRQSDIEAETRKSQLQQQRELEVARQQAELDLKKTHAGAVLAADQERLKGINTQADVARARQRDIEVLKPIAASMGPANWIADTEVGKQLRNALVTLKIGTPDQQAAMNNQQLWDTLRSGLFTDVHVPGIGAQSDWEGRQLIAQWGSNAQNPLDRLTAQSIAGQLADQRVNDAIDANNRFRRPDKGLEGFDENRKTQSVFDRPPDNPDDQTTQASYKAKHPVGEPYYSWAREPGGKWQQVWTRNLLNPKKGARPFEYLSSSDVTAPAGG
jgi:hypothetical protein